eukprot:8770261-Pyramimonas_sp.AAC.1
MAYRGWRGRQWYLCIRAIRCYASLLHFFGVDGGVCADPDGLHSLVLTLKRRWFDAELEELDHSNQVEE